MTNDISLAQTIPIRDAGLDEYWLQGQIFDNPACLGLGDLEGISKERLQSSGGRLDILLKNPEDDTMYEVEVMLGETDETHIIRTIEYWDNEKRRWPQRQHFAVLVAEHINRRFFNVIQLLSHSIPIIAVQVSLLEVNAARSIFFAKVLDTFQEVDDGTTLDPRQYNREYWIERAKWTLEAADALLAVTQPALGDATLNYVKNYVAIRIGSNNYLWLHKRSQGKSLLGFWVSQPLQDEAAAVLDARNITHVRKPSKIVVTVDRDLIQNNAEAFRNIAGLVRRSWETGG
jgi:predicted transport protein